MKFKMNYLVTAMGLLLTFLAQGQATLVSTMIEKENRNAVMIAINQPVDITTDALQQRMKRAGLNERTRKGAASYKGVILSEISKEKIDIYTKVEKAPNNTSNVYMAVSRGYDNFTNSAADSALTDNVIAFLNSFVKDADNQSADLAISSQISDVGKSEKAYQKLLDEQRDLEKKKSKIDSRLAEIQTALTDLKTDMDKRKSTLEESKSKRAGDNN